MSGICGFHTPSKINDENINEMNITMKHRGPDYGHSINFVINNANIGFAQRQLLIKGGIKPVKQPFYSVDKKHLIVFDGSIYNYREIADKLNIARADITDTEVVLAAYKKWGNDCCDHLDGAFAFAIYDFEKNLIYLARDRIGEKPLYYYHDGKSFVFASELKPIMAYPHFLKIIDHSVLGQYLTHGYIHAPKSIFVNTYKVVPGHYAIFKNNKVETHCYWDVIKVYLNNSRNQVNNYEQAKSELDDLICQAVRARMAQGKPIGSLLSGGIDSSLLTAIAQNLSDAPVKSFTVGFTVDEYNEAHNAKKIAEYLGTEHSEAYLDEDETLNLIDSIPYYYDEPFGDSSQIPTMFAASLAKQIIDVILTGDGGDEAFYGYPYLKRLKAVQRLDWLGGVIYELGEILRINDKLPKKLMHVVTNRDIRVKTQRPGYDADRQLNKLFLHECSEFHFPLEDKIPVKNWITKRMLVDYLSYLPGTLTKGERAFNKYALLSHSPMLDHKLIEYSFRLPLEFKFYKNIQKRITKDLLYKYVPQVLFDRPKSGFSMPAEKWLKTVLKDKLEDYCREEFISRQGLFNYEEIQKAKQCFYENRTVNSCSYKGIFWKYLILQIWYEKYMI